MEKAIPILFITALPFFVWGDTILQGQVNGLIFLTFFAAVMFIPNPWLKLLGLIATGWLGYAYSMSFVFHYSSEPTINAALLIFLGVLVYLFIIYQGRVFKKIETKYWMNTICISALIQASIGLCQFLGFDPMSAAVSNVINVRFNAGSSPSVGVTGNQNFLGAYLAISSIFFFRPPFNDFGGCKIHPKQLAFALIGGVLLMTKANTAIAAASVGLCWHFFGLAGVLAAIIPAAAYMQITDAAIWDGRHGFWEADRFQFWMDATNKIRFAPPSTFLFGYGPGTTWQAGNQLHSEYFATLFHYGTVGLAFMITYIKTSYRGHKILFTALIISCVNMIGNHPLHVLTTAILIITIIALNEREKMEVLT